MRAPQQEERRRKNVGFRSCFIHQRAVHSTGNPSRDKKGVLSFRSLCKKGAFAFSFYLAFVSYLLLAIASFAFIPYRVRQISRLLTVVTKIVSTKATTSISGMRFPVVHGCGRLTHVQFSLFVSSMLLKAKPLRHNVEGTYGMTFCIVIVYCSVTLLLNLFSFPKSLLVSLQFTPSVVAEPFIFVSVLARAFTTIICGTADIIALTQTHLSESHIPVSYLSSW